MKNENLRKYKLYLLQNRYIKITEYIFQLQNHIEKNFKNYLINNINKNVVLSKLFEISKSINTKYNNYINKELNISDNKDQDFKNIINKINNLEINEEKLFEIIKKYNSFKINSDQSPLEYSYQEIVDIASDYGYPSINKLLKFAIGNEINMIDSNILSLINELEEVVVPLSFDIFEKTNTSKKYYWKIPKIFTDYDFLEKTRELWIKLSKNKYIKIKLYFNIDPLSIRVKTCQINYPFLYKFKNNIIKELESNHFNIDNKFIKTFIRHDYLGNIYCMEKKELAKYIKKMYFKQIEISDTTFLNLMKEFISKNSSNKNMFDIIFLLLLSNEDSNDIGSLLLSLIKEKKSSNNLYNILYNNLTYYLQVKVKKSDITIKNELEKINSISIEDIDYKKQLLINKNIPDIVKSSTLEKIEEMKSFNNEYYKQLTFVKHILNFPWPSKNDNSIFQQLKNNFNDAKSYLENVENKLKKSSYGHDEAKKLLLQVIGKWISNPSSQGTSFGLVGPPGVGKTLLAKSVSKALDIPFAQITLGGQNDGELLHGHGYTYSGSQPGLIIKKMVEMGKSRCIIYFDELDKACSKHGSINEITSILIHLTDPNMNNTFQDRFFQGIEFPLDKVIMIFSYNDSKLVDPILLDRIKEIKIRPYTINDKLNICNKFIIPETIKSTGLYDKIIFDNKIIEYIINSYTNEAGVRGIKRLIENIYLQFNIDKIFKKGVFKVIPKKIKVTKQILTDILSDAYTDETKIHPKPEIGIVNGLYATSNGEGGIIPIQVFKNYSSESNKFKIKLTGNQGDVMKESVQCSLTTALDYIRINIKKYKHLNNNLDEYMKKNFCYGFHVHAPSTSTPKDGPSAGIAFTIAFISRILNKKIKNTYGMTGEIELTGRVTKIGGLNFKLIGAKKAGVKKIYIPFENKKDLDNIKEKYPKLINKSFSVQTCNNISNIVDDVLI
jgi:endopeptidase La